MALKAHRSAKWFLSPVDPVADGVPDYFKVVSRPMDLQTIEKKLFLEQYNHPFLWQQDVRQIFFNAFSYHSMSNGVWKDATLLAMEFERLCKQHEAINPHYMELICVDGYENANSSSSARKRACNNAVCEAKPADSDFSKSANRHHSHSHSHYSHHNNNNNNSNHPHNNSNRESSSLLHEHETGVSSSFSRGKKRRNTTSVVYVDVDMDDAEDSVSNVGKNTKARSKTSSQKESNRQSTSSSVQRGGKGANSRSAAANASFVNNSNSNANVDAITTALMEQFFHEPSPQDAPVLPPPPVPRIGVNDKPLSTSQRRTLDAHMQILGPQQRRAALELIQDDLGISAADHMRDRSFTFDTELLSIEKQKRLFAYVNSMVRANREIFMSKHQAEINESLNEHSKFATTSGNGNFNNNSNYSNNSNNANSAHSHSHIHNPGGVANNAKGSNFGSANKRMRQHDAQNAQTAHFANGSDDSDSSESSDNSTSSFDSLSSSTTSSDSEADNDLPGNGNGMISSGGKTHPGHYGYHLASLANQGEKLSNSSEHGKHASKNGGGRNADAQMMQNSSHSSNNNGRSNSNLSSSLPEYKPVAEDGEKIQIREDIMGHNVDFIGIIDPEADETVASVPKNAKSTAWQEWKGQVIQQGFVTERAAAPQRSASEIIAEGYDARI